jgi:hypothetical protein
LRRGISNACLVLERWLDRGNRLLPGGSHDANTRAQHSHRAEEYKRLVIGSK